jgi:hypothetical protein
MATELFNLASVADLAVQNPGNLIDIVFDNSAINPVIVPHRLPLRVLSKSSQAV